MALAKAARVFDVPVVLSTVETKGFSGNMWPQIQAVFPKQTPIERTTMNSWDDENFVAAVEKSGRKKIVLAGLWTETCVALPTIQAIHDGYEIYVVEDCCGDVSQLAHDNAMKRVIQAGAKPVTALSVMLEWQRDWANKDTYDAVMDIVKTHCGAYGVGVEYAYTMVHGAPATRFPEYVVPTAAGDSTNSDLRSRGRRLAMPADVILHNAKIATNRVPSFVEAVAIEGGKIVAVGTSDEILRQRGPATLVIDAGGRTVIPGLNDSHLHLIRGGLNYNMELRWDGVPSLADALRMLQGAGRAHPAAAVGARRRRLDRVPVRRAADADARRDQRRRARHAGVRPAPLRPGAPEPGGPAGRRLHARTRPTRPAARSSGTGRAIRPAC